MRSRLVLVVAPSAALRARLRSALEDEGYLVLEASDGSTALAEQKRSVPDVVVQDLILPDMSGVEFLRRLRLGAGGDSVPIVAISGFLRVCDATIVAAAGFSGLLFKPVDPDLVVQAVNGQFPVRRSERLDVGKGRSVLLVDDDPIQIKLLGYQLEADGFHVTATSTGEQALRAARASVPDAIVSDALTPVMDGFELCQEIRRDVRLAHVPILLLSLQHIEPADLDLARKAGATRFIVRPRKSRTLVEALLEILECDVQSIPAEPVDLISRARADYVNRKLRRQVFLNAELAELSAMQATQLSLLGGMADSLAHGGDAASTLAELLPGCLDAAGISKGVLYIAPERNGDHPTYQNAVGFSPEERIGLGDFFGCLPVVEQVISTEVALRMPSAAVPDEITRKVMTSAGVKAALVVPLGSVRGQIGALFAASDLPPSNGSAPVAFVKVLGRQIGQAMLLAKTFSELTSALAVRDDFLTVAGHELRTPLTAARLGVQSLTRTLVSAPTLPTALVEVPQKITLVDRQLVRLESLVELLLDANRMEDDNRALHREYTDLVAMVASAIQSSGNRGRRNAPPQISLRADRAVRGLWDRVRIETVVSNLLSNAIKFSSDQPIEISIDQRGACAVLSVRDHGIGIGGSDHERVFEKFQRAVSSRNYGGWGVGLWLARRQVEAHGGTIRVESEPDKGATFIVELPLGPPASSESSLHQ